MRVADRHRHAMTQYTAVEFERREQGALDVAMGVDEPGDHDFAADVDLALAPVFAKRADDPVGADRDVALDELAAHEIEDPAALEHDIRLGEPLPLLDRATKKGDGVAHEWASAGS